MKNILIIKTGALGDVLRTTVILEGLKDKFKWSRITWLTAKSAKSILEGNKHISSIITNPKKILKKKWDLIISLEENEEILKHLKYIKFYKLFGLYYDKEIKYTEDSAPWFDMGLVSRFGKKKADKLKKINKKSYPKMLYEMLDLKWRKQKYSFNPGTIKSRRIRKIVENLPKINVVGVVIGAGKRWPMKALPKDRLGNLLSKIPPHKTVILLHGPGEAGLAKQLKRKHPNTLILGAMSIKEYAQIVGRCNKLISPDTLGMHVGIAMGTNVIAYFTVTPAEEIEIYKGKKIKARHKDYASYSKKKEKRPNMTDQVSLSAILREI